MTKYTFLAILLFFSFVYSNVNAQVIEKKSDNKIKQDSQFEEKEKNVTSLKLGLLTPAPKPNVGRIVGLSSAALLGYSAAMISLNEVWYKQYPRTSFHFFDDNAEWQQIDKVGHAWTAYSEGVYGVALYRWAGLRDPAAIWVGGMAGWFFQAGIEVLDGFSEKWGASIGDIVANSLGTALVIGQELAWKEQRIRLKFSSHLVDYQDYEAEIQTRVDDLYGVNFQELLLKDYNGQSYWLSVNPHSFLKNEKSKFPKWLNIAVGYGAENMFGGFENKWQNEIGTIFDYTDVTRYRQFFLSLDVDLSRIKTKSKFLKLLLGSINVLKIPAPTLEWNTKGEIKWHYLYW